MLEFKIMKPVISVIVLFFFFARNVAAQSLLPEPEWTNTPAVLKGQIIGYDEDEENMTVEVYPYAVYDLDIVPSVAEIKEDGSFRMEIPMYATRQGMFASIGPWYGLIVLTAGDSLCVTLDLPEHLQTHPKDMVMRKMMPYVEHPLVFEGALADLNNDISRFSVRELIWYTYGNVHQNDTPMSPEKLYDAVIRHRDKVYSRIDTLDIRPVTKELLRLNAESSAAAFLLRRSRGWVNTDHVGCEYFKKVISEFEPNTLKWAYTADLPSIANALDFAIFNDTLALRKNPETDSLYALKNEQGVPYDKAKAYAFYLLGGSDGVIQDGIIGQGYASKLSQDTPLDEKELESLSMLKNKTVSHYFLKKNERLKAELEARKNGNHYTIFASPTNSGEAFLSEIGKEHSGKVVLMDFWGTWCGPCRDAIQDFEEKHKKLSELGLVTVYVTDGKSPEDTWKNMASGMDGLHYRLKDKQTREIFDKFGFRGWPSYLVIDKKGRYIYDQTGFHEEEMYETILKALKEDL